MNLVKVSEDTVVNIHEIIALNHQGVALFANGQTLKLSVEAAKRIVDYCPDLPARKPATKA